MNERFFAGVQADMEERLKAKMKSVARGLALSAEMSAWFPTPVPTPIAKAFSAACVVDDGEPSHAARSLGRGSCAAFMGSSVHEGGRPGEPTLTRHDRGQETSFTHQEFDRVSERKKQSDRHRDPRRQCTPGLQVAELDGPTVATSENWGEQRPSVGFRNLGIRNTIQKSSREQRHQPKVLDFGRNTENI